ncbi:MAG: hypothetical protein EP329_10965, partial [Deltaproteobacteria bacterium]
MPAWLPSFIALGALLVALVAGPGDDDVPLLRVASEAPVSAPSDDATVVAEAEATPVEPPAEAVAEEKDRGPKPLATPVEAWPLALPAGRVDAITARADRLYVAVQELPERPLIDPAIVRVHALDRDGAELGRPWQAAILGASAVTLASSGPHTLAAWTHRAHPGRSLAVARLDGEDGARFEVLAPEGEAFAPAGRPLVAPAADGGFLVCTNVATQAPRCVAVDADGGRRWTELRGLRHYALWRLVENGAGYFLFGTDCGRSRWTGEEASALTCRTPRIVLQALDGAGRPHGPLRWIARFQGNRELDVVPLGDDVMLFGRRATGRDSTALIITRRVVEELEGRWNRTAAGLDSPAGALLLEVDKLRMEDGVPVAGYRPRRWSRSEGRAEPEAWPEAIAARAPRSL